MSGCLKSALESKDTLASRAMISPAGVVINGLISTSMAFFSQKRRYSPARTLEKALICSPAKPSAKHAAAVVAQSGGGGDG